LPDDMPKEYAAQQYKVGRDGYVRLSIDNLQALVGAVTKSTTVALIGATALMQLANDDTADLRKTMEELTTSAKDLNKLLMSLVAELPYEGSDGEDH
jgi:hypothetical protein